MAVKLEVKLEAQAISKIKEHFDSMNGFAHIMEGLREGSLIEKDAATMIDGIKDKTKRNRYSVFIVYRLCMNNDLKIVQEISIIIPEGIQL